MIHFSNAPAYKLFEEEGASVRAANKRFLVEVCLRRIAALLILDGAHDDMFWMKRSGSRILLTKKRCAPQCEHNDSEHVTPDSCPGFFTIAIVDEKAPLIALLGIKLFVFYVAEEIRAMAKKLQMGRATIQASFVFVSFGHLYNAGVRWEVIFRL